MFTGVTCAGHLRPSSLARAIARDPMNEHDLAAAMQSPPAFETNEGPDDYARFWMPARFGEGMFWVGQWRGTSPWERHPEHEELLCALAGEYEVTILSDVGEEKLTVKPGTVVVVPRNHWHRVHAAQETTGYGVTPGPTDHHEGDDPRTEGA